MSQDIADMKLEVDGSDVDQATVKLDRLGETMKKTAATSELFARTKFGQRLSGEYGMAASKIAQAASSISRIRAEQARQEEATSRLVIGASRAIQNMRDKEAADATRSSAMVLRARDSMARAQVAADAKAIADTNKRLAAQKRAADEEFRMSTRTIAANRGLARLDDARAKAAEASANREIAAEQKKNDMLLRVNRSVAKFAADQAKLKDAAAKKAESAAAREVAAEQKKSATLMSISSRIRRMQEDEIKQRERLMASAGKQAQAIIAANQRMEAAEGRRVASLMRQETAQRRMFERAQAAAARQAAAAEKYANRSGQGLLGTLSSLRGSILSINGLIAGLGLVALYDALNKYTELTNIMKVLGFEGSSAALRLREIQDVARETRGPLDELTKIYQKTTMAANELGATQEQILEFTRNIGLALAQQGGATASTRGALLQLSQAIGMGTVRAEEFNSLLEGGYPILVAAARGIEETGGSVMKLRQMMLAGELSSKKFFDAILSQTDNLQATFGRTIPTLSQSLQVFRDTFMVSMGEMDHAVGFSETLSRGIMRVSQAFVDLARTVTANGDSIREFAGNLQALGVIAVAFAVTHFGSKLLNSINAAGGAMMTFSKATNVAAAAFRAFLPALALAAAVGFVNKIMGMNDALEQYATATKTAEAAQADFNVAMSQFENDRTVESAAALKAMTDARIQALQDEMDAAKEVLADQEWMTALDFGFGESIQIFDNPAADETRAKIAEINAQLVVQQGILGMASATLQTMAGTFGAAAVATDDMTSKAVEHAAASRVALQMQIDMAEAIINFGAKSAQVEQLKRDQAEMTAAAFAVQNGYNVEIATQYVEQAMALYDMNVEIEQIDEKTKRIAESAKTLLDDYRQQVDTWKEQRKAITDLTAEYDNQLAAAKIAVQYGEDSIQATINRQREERNVLEAQLDSTNASEQQKNAILSASDAANALRNQMTFLPPVISDASREAMQLAMNLGLAMAQLNAVVQGIRTAQRTAQNIAKINIETVGDPQARTRAIAEYEMLENSGTAAYAAIRQGNTAALEGIKDTTTAVADETLQTFILEEQARALDQAFTDSQKSAEKASKEKGKAQKDLLADLNKELDYRQSLIGISDEEIAHREVIKEVTDKLSGSEKKYTQEVINGAIERTLAIEEQEKAWDRTKQVIDDMSSAIGDFVASGLTDFKGFANSVLGIFKRMLADMIATAARNRIMIGMGFSGIPGMSGAGGVGGVAGQAAGGMGGAGGILGGLGTLGGSILSGVAGGLSSLAGGLGSFMQYTTFMAKGATAGLAGLGGAIGALALPVAAAVAVFTFFKKSTKELDAGLRISVRGMDTWVQTFRKTETKRFWGLSKKTRTSYNDAEKGTSDFVVKIVSDIQDAVEKSAEALGFGANTFRNFAHTMKISTRGMNDDQVREALENALGGLSDAYANMIPGLERLTRVGETGTEALTRLSSSLVAVNTAMGQLGLSTHRISLAGADAASAFVDLFGGLEQFVQASQFYLNNFFSGQERYDIQRNTLTSQFEDAGVRNMPRTEAQFRALVERMDAAGNSEGVAQLLLLAPAFIEMLNAGRELEEQTNVITDVMRERYDLETQLLTAQGNTAELRRRELLLLDPSNRALQRQIWAQEHLNDVANQRESLERRLLELSGNTTEIRRQELAALYPANRALQEQIWLQETMAERATERRDLETQLLTAQGNTAELRRRELEALHPANRALQQQIWAREELNAITEQQTGLETQLLQLQGNTAEIRRRELAALYPRNRALQLQIWALQDAAELEERLANIREERLGLESQLLLLQGNTVELRRRELMDLDPSNRALQERIWRLEDEKEIMEERKGLESTLLELQGNTTELRRLELAALHSSNRALQLQIWAIEDAREAQERATAAVDDARSAAEKSIDVERERIKNMRDAANTLRGLSDNVMEATRDTSEAQRLAAERQLRVALEAGRVWDDSLQSLAERAADVDVNNFSSYTDFMIASSKAASLFEAMAAEQERQAQSAEDRLEVLLERYGLQEETVLSLTEALNNLDAALRLLAQAEQALSPAVPGAIQTQPIAAPGSVLTPGLPQTNTNQTLNNEIVLLRQEVVRLREENNQGNVQIAKNTKDVSDRQRKWDVDGMPNIRELIS